MELNKIESNKETDVKAKRIDSRKLKRLGSRSQDQMERVEYYAKNIPGKFRGAFLRAIEGKASPMEAIKAHCHACIGFENVAEAIADCRGALCPLYSYRPYKEST